MKKICVICSFLLLLLVTGCNSSNTIEPEDTLDVEENVNYVSVLECNAYFDDEKEKQIYTYYYDENEKVNRIVISTYWKENSVAQDNYESCISNTNYKNVKIDGNVVTLEYTEEAFMKYFANIGMTRSSVIEMSNDGCSENAIVEWFKPNIE